MKKIILAVFLLAFSFVSSFAQNDILSGIEAAGERSKTIKEPFTETAINSAGKASAPLKGELTYKAPDGFSMIYSEPAGDFFMISGKMMKESRAGVETVYDLEKNVMMRSLSHILLYSFSGRIKTLADELGADCEATAVKGGYHVILTAKVKSTRGLASVDLFYDSAFNITKMIMTEWSKRSTVYELAK